MVASQAIIGSNKVFFMHSEKQFKEKDEISFLKAALEAATDGILIVSIEGKIVYYNQNFVTMWNLPPVILRHQDREEMIKFVANQLVDPEGFTIGTLSLISIPDLEFTDELFFKDGRIFERCIKPHKVGNKIIGRIINFRDVTERKRLDEQLFQQATHDPLTGLPNRQLLIEHLQQAIGYAKRTNLNFAILFADIDHYKIINDSFGHTVGDALLCDVAIRLQNSIRENDIVVRLGGDEFVIVVTTLPKPEDVIPVVTKIIDTLSIPFICEGHEIKITVSIGISIYTSDEQTPEVLLKEADAAMYCAKKMGRNNYQFYEKEL